MFYPQARATVADVQANSGARAASGTLDYFRPAKPNGRNSDMSARFSTTREFAGTLLALCLATAPAMAAHDQAAYLPLAGPAPLRFEADMAQTFVFSPAKSDDPTPVVETVEPPANAAPETALVSTTNTNANAAQPTLVTPSIGESTASTPAAASPAAGDMLVVTPQMLAEFFKPMPGATNGAGVSVFAPVPLGFTPPVERTPPSSRATYRTE